MRKKHELSRLDQIYREQTKLLENIRQSLEVNHDLDPDHRLMLVGRVDQLKRHFKNSYDDTNEVEFIERVTAFESAYYLGAYKVLSPENFQAVVKAGKRQGMSTVREGTRAAEFQEYLAPIAHKFWKKNKTYVGNFEGTAARIIDDVYRNLASVQVVPSRIRNKDITKKRDRNLAIRSIAERLKKLSAPQN